MLASKILDVASLHRRCLILISLIKRCVSSKEDKKIFPFTCSVLNIKYRGHGIDRQYTGHSKKKKLSITTPSLLCIYNWSLQPFSQDYDLASHTTFRLCVLIFIHKRRDLQFNIDSE